MEAGQSKPSKANESLSPWNLFKIKNAGFSVESGLSALRMPGKAA
jgi:hypothetical protein